MRLPQPQKIYQTVVQKLGVPQEVIDDVIALHKRQEIQRRYEGIVRSEIPRLDQARAAVREIKK